jgi:hypothetical protein
MSRHPGYSADAFDLVAYHDLDGMPGFKLALQVVSGRWFLYVTRFWEVGTTVLDVTDPAVPQVVGAIPGPDDANVATWQVQVADNLLVHGIQHRPPPWGGDPLRATEEGMHIWDVTDPTSPRHLSSYRFGASGTHRNLFTGGRYLHAAASFPGIDGFAYAIVDIDDPMNPQEVGRWFMPEQFTAAGATSDRKPSHHGPAWVIGDRAYLPYGGGGLVLLDISDPAWPRLISRLEFGAAFSSRVALHTVVPLPERGIAVVNTEAIAEMTAEPYNYAGIVDISNESDLRLISLLPVPIPDQAAPYPNFNKRGGRFGPHNQHHPHPEHQHLLHDDQIVYLTWFNAGLRVYDISDPYLPREIGHFLPDDPVERRGLLPKTALVTQSEDVLVDSRGYAYLTDKNHGLHVLRFTG